MRFCFTVILWAAVFVVVSTQGIFVNKFTFPTKLLVLIEVFYIKVTEKVSFIVSDYTVLGKYMLPSLPLHVLLLSIPSLL